MPLLRNGKEFANIISSDKVILLEWAPKPVTGVTIHSHTPESNNTGHEVICVISAHTVSL